MPWSAGRGQGRRYVPPHCLRPRCRSRRRGRGCCPSLHSAPRRRAAFSPSPARRAGAPTPCRRDSASGTRRARLRHRSRHTIYIYSLRQTRPPHCGAQRAGKAAAMSCNHYYIYVRQTLPRGSASHPYRPRMPRRRRATPHSRHRPRGAAMRLRAATGRHARHQ